MQILNIAGYKFTTLTDLPSLQALLMQCGCHLSLKGTILISAEGININLAGTISNLTEFKRILRNDHVFSDMTFRESYSNTIPFKRFKVKIKKEIITMRQPDIQPEKQSVENISPEQFKKWLDEKKDITILDTRNAYEVEFGTFENAIHLGLNDFSEFNDASQSLTKEKPVVMFCTGGIRCEKAGLDLLDKGFPTVYQLAGGILNYFAKVGGEHYDGECFVFDERVSLNSNLQITGTTQCKQCQGPIKNGSLGCFSH
jgi:UPF0176 protein